MQTHTWLAASLVGLITGILCLLWLGRWILSPPNEQMRRGYLNAVVVGLLLAAAIEFIPNTLGEVEFVSYHLLNTYLIAPLNPQPDTALWMFTRPTQIQSVARPFMAVVIIVLFFKSNGVRVVPQAENQTDPVVKTSGWRAWLALPPLEQHADQPGLVIVVLGLLCYTWWMGVLRPSPQLASQPYLFASIALLIFSGAGLGVATLGLIPSLERYWPWVVSASLLLGLTTLSALIDWPEEPLVYATPLLLAGTVCLVYGLGRLLRVLQYQIGTGWRTSVVVLASAGLLYFGTQWLSTI